MYDAFSQYKNPERLMHEHLFITITICWFTLVIVICKEENTISAIKPVILRDSYSTVVS
jgi:hypothetical protein